MLYMKTNGCYKEFIDSDDITDEILYGKRNYPVIDLCHAGEFNSARILLQKGYKCLHEDALHDVKGILNAVIHKNIKATDGEDAIPYILEKLSDELEHMDRDDYAILVNSLGHQIAQTTSGSMNMQIISLIRMALPQLYAAFLSCGKWSISDLMGFDTELVNEYLEYLKEKNLLMDFVHNNRVNEQQAQALLLQLMRLDDSDLLEQGMNNLFRISLQCLDIFPIHFTCDVAILASISKLRMITETLPEHFPQPDTEIFTTNGEVLNLLCKLSRLLRFHMHEGYAFDQVARIMILYCGADGTEYDLEPRDLPQDCDYFVLEEVVRFAKITFQISKLPISESSLKNTRRLWEETHNDSLWSYNHEAATPAIERLVRWFFDNCELR